MANPNSSGKTAPTRTDELVADMEERFPAVRDFLPLASGIEDELARHYSGDPSWRVIAALKRHVGKPAYLRSILTHHQRFDLAGDPKGEVGEAERLYAQDQLRDLEGSENAGKDPLGQITEGYRLLLCKQVGHRFGTDGAHQSRPYLDKVHSEKALEKAGIHLLDCSTLEEWIHVLATLEE